MEKQRCEKSRRRRQEVRKSEKRKRRKKMQEHEQVGNPRFAMVFPMICGSGGSKSRLAKAAGAEPASQMRNEKVARRCGTKHILK